MQFCWQFLKVEIFSLWECSCASFLTLHNSEHQPQKHPTAKFSRTPIKLFKFSENNLSNLISVDNCRASRRTLSSKIWDIEFTEKSSQFSYINHTHRIFRRCNISPSFWNIDRQSLHLYEHKFHPLAIFPPNEMQPSELTLPYRQCTRKSPSKRFPTCQHA